MNAKHLMLLSAASVLLLSSCESTIAPITQEEKYTHAFINKFGIIAPDQDWNTAEATDVTIDLGSTKAKSVKVYAKVGESYFITADLSNVTGSIKVPIDVPEGTQDLLVKVDGKTYHAAPGDNISIKGPGSRSIIGTALGETTLTDGNNNTYTITVSEGDYMYFNAQQIAPITADFVWDDYYAVRQSGTGSDVTLTYEKRINPVNVTGNTPYVRQLTSSDLFYNTDIDGYGILPELEHEVNANGYGNTSLTKGGKKQISQDFTINTGDNNTITIYPMYVNTTRNNDLGLYFIDESGNPIKDDKGEILRFPFYNCKGNDWEYYSRAASGSSSTEYYIIDGALPEAFLDAYTDYRSGISSDLEGFYRDFREWYEECCKSTTFEAYPSDENFNVSNWTKTTVGNSTLYSITSIEQKPSNATIYVLIGLSPKSAMYPDDLPDELKHSNGTFQTVSAASLKNDYADAYDEESNPDGHNYGKEENASYYTHRPLLMRVKGITVNLGEFSGKIGMYIKNGDDIQYSEIAHNSDGVSHAASYVHPMSTRTYFSFEDWPNGGDKDLNDLIFMLADFDAVSGDIEIPGESSSESGSSNTPDTPINWLWAVEDLGSTDDFDFNDIVVKINSVTTNFIQGGDGVAVNPEEQTEGTQFYKKVTFTALAAGGTLETYVKWTPSGSAQTFYLRPGTFVNPSLGGSANTIDGVEVRPTSTLTSRDDEAEFHRWFGETDHTTMINTTSNNRTGQSCVIYTTKEFTVDGFGTDVKAGDAKTIGLAIEIANPPAGYASENSDIDGSYTVAKPGKGAAPQMFIIHEGSTKWKWPTERTSIMDAYNMTGASFRDWVGDKSIKWFEKPTGAVINRNDQ